MCNSKYKISIPEPCHEDWGKMTPEQQGRFCGVCSKVVVDFSNKTPQEVDAIIDEKKGQKVCGRFKSEQVSAPVTISIPPFIPTRQMSMKHLFAVALFLVFGTGLFSCQSNQGELVGKIAITGDISVEPITTILPVKDTAKVSTLKMDTLVPEELHVKGEMVMPPEIYALGGPRFIENPDFIPEPPITCVIPDTLKLENNVDQVVGMMVYHPELPEVEIPEPIDSVFTDVIIVEELPEDTNDFFPEVSPLIDLTTYPNPTNGRITISYDVFLRTDAVMAIYDLAGKMRKELFDINGMYSGKYTLTTDLSDLPSGTYFIVFTAGDQQKSSKVILQK